MKISIDSLYRFFKQFRHTYYMTREHRLLIMGLGILAVLVGCWDGVIYSIMIPVVNSLLSGNAITDFNTLGGPLGIFFKDIKLSEELLRIYGIFLVILSMIIRNVLNATVLSYNTFVFVRVITKLRIRILEQYLNATQSFLDDQKSGNLVQTLIVESREVVNFPVHFFNALGYFVNILVLTFILISLSLKLTIVVFIFIVIITIIKYFYTKKIKKLSEEALFFRKEFSSLISEYLSSIKHIKIYNLIKKIITQSRKFTFQGERKIQKSKLLAKWEMPLVQIEGLIMIGVIFLLGRNGYFINEIIPIGIIISFLIVLQRFIPIVSICSSHVTHLYQTIPIIDYVYTHFALSESDIEDPGGIKKIPFIKEKIEFKDISLNYKRRKNILNKLNLTIKKGERIGLVGESGAGKTSVINLLLKFYDPVNGKILIDDTPLEKIEKSWVRNNIGLVSQDIHLFNLSIQDTIKLGNKNKTNYEQIKEAAIKADAHQFIEKLPQKYNTIVGEKGVKLSGGQKQRLSISQVLLKNPDIVIFDEATSALDSQSEKKVMETIIDKIKDKTIIIIAHRLATLKYVDRIYVLAKGEIVEYGNWNDLTQKKGVFWKMVEQQKLEKKQDHHDFLSN